MNTANTDDFFRSRLDQMIDLRHPLAVLDSRFSESRLFLPRMGRVLQVFKGPEFQKKGF